MAAKTRSISVRDSVGLAKALATNSTATSFTAPAATLTRPANAISVRRAGSVANRIMVVPYALGDDDDVFDMWVTGWRKITADGVTLWVPTRLVKLTCTVGTCVGVAASPVLATERFADTITASMGVSNVSYELFSTTDNTPAHAIVSLDGCDLVEFTFDLTTGDPTSANCLYARI